MAVMGWITIYQEGGSNGYLETVDDEEVESEFELVRSNDRQTTICDTGDFMVMVDPDMWGPTFRSFSFWVGKKGEEYA